MSERPDSDRSGPAPYNYTNTPSSSSRGGDSLLNMLYNSPHGQPGQNLQDAPPVYNEASPELPAIKRATDPHGKELPEDKVVVLQHLVHQLQHAETSIDEAMQRQLESESQRTEAQLDKAKKRQETFLKERREQKKRKVFYQRLKFLLQIVFTLLLLVSFPLAWHFGYWRYNLYSTTLFAPAFINQETLKPLLTPYEHRFIFKVRPNQLSHEIKAKFPFIENAYISRTLFPVGLRITLTEKPVWGVLLAKPPKLHLKPKEDTALATLQQAQPMYLLHWDQAQTDLAAFNLPVNNLDQLTQTVRLVSNRSSLPPKQFKQFQELGLILQKASPTSPLLYVDISNPADITAYYPDFKVRLGKNDASIIKRTQRLAFIVPEILKQPEKIDYVDLRWNQQVTFRKRSAKSSS